MHWIAFGILLYLTTVLQTTVAPVLAVHGVRPDFLSIVAAYYALTARKEDSLVACWFIGLAADLTGLGYARHCGFGASSLAMGAIGIAVVTVRELTFRESVITQLTFSFVISFCFGLLTGLCLYISATNRPPAWDVVQSGFYGAVYTAVIAPYCQWGLRKMRNMLGLPVTRRVRVD